MYKHTQHVPSIILTACGMLGSFAAQKAPKPLRTVTGLSIAGVLYTFRCLTVTVDQSNIIMDFGKWLRVKTIPLDSVESCKIKETNALIGWGIHFVGDGWLYRVSGQDAVRVKLKTGQRIYIGSDEPIELADAINKSIAVFQQA